MKPCVEARSLSLPPVSLSYEDLKVGHPEGLSNMVTAPLARGREHRLSMKASILGKRRLGQHTRRSPQLEARRSAGPFQKRPQPYLTPDDQHALQLINEHQNTNASFSPSWRSSHCCQATGVLFRHPSAQSGAFKTQATSRVRFRPCSNMGPAHPPYSFGKCNCRAWQCWPSKQAVDQHPSSSSPART